MKLFIYCLGIVLFFGSCEDKKKASQNENEIENEVKIDTSAESILSGVEGLSNQKIEIEKKDSIAYPEITNDNVVSFLTEYGKIIPKLKF